MKGLAGHSKPYLPTMEKKKKKKVSRGTSEFLPLRVKTSVQKINIYGKIALHFYKITGAF